MPVRLTCPQGHQYDSTAGACPFCAQPAQGATLMDPTHAPANDPQVTAEHVPGQVNGPAPTVPPAATSDGQSVPMMTEAPAESNQFTRVEPSAGPGPVRAPPLALGTIAGYELLEVLGRGGMGIVYKARQKKLHRLVALKMILAGAHAGRQQLARFTTEAQAVAKLQHPNIVQIHEVGEHEGQPYLSLEFVDGPSLDKQFAGKPQDPREAARLVATLARAVEVAHDEGIVHRDLKPPNILIQRTSASGQGSGLRKKPDSKTSSIQRKSITPMDLRAPSMGVPKITDFGLAKQMDTEDSNTVTGAIMGTPSYMAPEQATGKTHEIGPPADIYSLGAILYEALTGRPPFAGVTPLETLRQVQTQEPVPPTRLQPKLPRDVETICLKCLDKEPQRRYASAAELGDDLERFLTGEPIQARPVSPWMRGVKWARRRPAFASLIAVSAVAILAFVGLILWSNLELTARNIQIEAEKQRAQEETLRAVRNAQKARKAVDDLLRAVADELEDVPQLEKTRRTLLERALVHYQDFLNEKSDDPLIKQELARTCKQVGDIYFTLGEHSKSQEHYGRMMAIAAVLPEETRQEPAFVRDLAAAYNGRARSLKATDKLTDSVADGREALRVLQMLPAAMAQTADGRQERARFHYFLGASLEANPGGLPEAEAQYQDALRLQQALVQSEVTNPSQRRELARTLNNLGRLQSRTKRTVAATASFEAAKDLQQALAREFPEKPYYRRELARTCSNLAVLQVDMNRLPDAEKAYEQVQTLLNELVRDFPSVPDYRNELGMCLANQAMLARRQRRFAHAEEFLRNALDVQRKLTVEFATVGDYRQRLGGTLIALANLHRDERRDVPAAEAYREAILIYEQLLRDAQKADYHNGLAIARFALGMLRARHGCIPVSDISMSLGTSLCDGLTFLERVEELRSAVRHHRQAVELNPLNDLYRTDLCKDHLALVETLVQINRHDEAARSAAAMAAVLPEDQTQAFLAAKGLARCVAAAERDERLSPSERAAVQERYALEAVTLLRRAIAKGFKNLDALSKPPFDALQQNPGFRRLLDELKVKTTKEIT